MERVVKGVELASFSVFCCDAISRGVVVMWKESCGLSFVKNIMNALGQFVYV